MNIIRGCYFLCAISLCGCSAVSVISKYQASVPVKITSPEDCVNQNKIEQTRVNYQYKAIYPIDKKSFSAKELELLIKKDAQNRLLFYYKLPSNFNLTGCVAEEKLEWKKSNRYIDAQKDSTDLREKEDETLEFKVKEI